MNKKEAMETIKNLFTKFEYTDEQLTEIETIMKNYLATHPKDTDMWLRLTMLEMMPPWEDPYRMVSYLATILMYDPHNIQAILTLAYIESLFFGEMKESTFTALCNLKTNDLETLSMIEYAKSFNYEKRDEEKYVQHLLKSIEYYDKHVTNFIVLGKYYLKKGLIEKGKKLIKKALNNVQGIYGVNYEKTDRTDIQEFFNYYYKGIYETIGAKEDLKELINE